MKKGFKLLGILFAMTGLLTACGSDDDFVPIIITPTPTITAVAPSSGPPGTTVTITGTNFSTTSANNIVKFNGTTAVVTSSTATEIVTTVPVGATTGFITVTRGIKTATSDPIIFTVTTPTTTTLMGGSIQGIELSLTTAVTTFAGTVGVIGSADGIGTAASFSRPAGVTTDGTNLFVADYNNRTIRKIEIATGTVTTLAGTPGTPAGFADGTGPAASFNGPAGITTDGTNLYVGDYNNNAIRKIVISSGVVTTLAGNGTAGSTDGIGAAATFNQPAGITTDGTNLYVTDYAGQTIRKIVISSGVVTTIAGQALTPGSTDAIIGTDARFLNPHDITTDGTNLYVADFNNDTIRQIEIATGAVTTLAGTAGTPGSADGTGPAASFNGPAGVTTDGTNLYVTDRLNNTIRKIVISSGVVTTLAGNGTAGSTDGTGTAALFDQPIKLTTDGTNLYVSDWNNFIIRKIE